MKKKRVAVTGVGLITPIGNNVAENWDSLIHGKSGVSQITRFDVTKFPVKIAGEVKNFKPEPLINTKDQRKFGLFIQYAVFAAHEALKNANLDGRFGESGNAEKINPTRVGTLISAGMGGLPEIQYWDRELISKEKKSVSPFFIPMVIPNMASGQISISLNAQGPSSCIVTACASSTHGIGESARLIQTGLADIMICGGAEAVICELGIVGFASMKALSQRNEDPTHASRPYDKDRDGFILSEGAGVLILEEWEHAKNRGANILAEFKGYALNADAYHMTSPAPEGRGAETCMRLALKDAELNPESIGYINSHGTSTPTGDSLEASAIAKVFQSLPVNVSSTKSMTGHLLGAAGAVEAIYSILALQNQLIPPTTNLDQLDEESAATKINFTPNNPVSKKFDYALSNSFGFGGTNGSLIFSKV